ncbi:MAG: hypothetical protein FWG06_01175 [Clostridiales bacterium]|nr:hypothetical protein [Clostridiales bacterium]
MPEKNNTAFKISLSGLLIAVGIVIPMFSPIKIVLEPASFTLASHVAIFIAMFISPGVAGSVAIGTAFGFFLGGFPVVIVLRAASHIVFSLAGALFLRKLKGAKLFGLKLRLFSFSVALIHAFCELTVVSVFYFGGGMSASFYQKGFFLSVLLLVGLGTVVHSMIDFEIANGLLSVLKKQKSGVFGQP